MIPHQTHNVAITAPISDFVVSIHDGRVFEQGTAKQILKHDALVAEEARHDEEEIKKAEEEIDRPEAGGSTSNAEGKLIEAEEIAVGKVGWAPSKF